MSLFGHSRKSVRFVPLPPLHSTALQDIHTLLPSRVSQPYGGCNAKYRARQHSRRVKTVEPCYRKISTLLPCVLQRKIQRRWHEVTEGLTLTAKKFMKSFQPLSSETTVSSVSPLYFSATQGRRLQCFILPYKNSSDYNKSKKCVTLLPCARMCDRGGGRRPEG